MRGRLFQGSRWVEKVAWTRALSEKLDGFEDMLQKSAWTSCGIGCGCEG